jgi:SAM-dependent methyltransferase
MPDCPICHTASEAQFVDHDHLRIAGFEGWRSGFFRCEPCGVVFQAPAFALAETSAGLKGSEVRAQNPFGTGPSSRLLYDAYYAFSRSEILGRRPPGRPRLLDVGCGVGQFCRVASRRFEAWGIEVSPEACAVARERLGLERIVCGSLREDTFEVRFDVVTFWQTIEHLEGSPERALETARALLNPGGCLFLGEVPNYRALEFRLFRGSCSYLSAPAHNFLFSEDYFRRTLPRLGFIDVRIHHNWKNPTLLSQSLLAALAARTRLRLGVPTRFVLAAAGYPLLLPLNVVLALAGSSATFSVEARRE